MNANLKRLRQLGEQVRLKIARRIHRIAFAIGGAFTAAYKEKPDAIHALWNAIPGWAYFLAAIPFYFIVDALLHPGDKKAD